ncbi:MAG TPA: MazG family protein [Kribbella sp.]
MPPVQNNESPPGGLITVILTSPRVAPGLLTHATWQALEAADEISAAAGPSRPDVHAVEASGFNVDRVTGEVTDHWSRLTSSATGGARTVWLVGDDGEPALLRVVADDLNRDPRPSYQVEIVHGSYDVPGARLIDVVRVMDRLRSRCPWDREQTHRSLARYLLEETYETLEAIETGDRDHLREELGDILLQVAFHSRIAEEGVSEEDRGETDGEWDDTGVSGGEAWSIDDVAADIVEKLVRRHPHVFGDTAAADAAAVEANWETIKAAEKQRTSVLEGIPQALPALALADKLLSRAAKLHPTPSSVPSDPASRGSSVPSDREGYGEELLEVVRRAREDGVDAEQALRDATRRLADQIRAAEAGR